MVTIPLANDAHQEFSVQIGDNLLDFRLNYITRSPGWSVDISLDGVRLISGAMLVPGAEITKIYRAGIGRLVFVGDAPTLDNLGKSNALVLIDA